MTAWRALAGLAGVLVAALCAPSARASTDGGATTDVDISRVTVKLPGDGWTISDKLPYGVSVSSSAVTVDGERRLLVAGAPGTRSEIVLLVSATRGHGGVTEHAECDPEDGKYVRKFNRGQSNYIPLQCLRVIGPARFPADPLEFGGDLGAAMADRHVTGPPGGYYVTVDVCNENGAVVEIQALIGNEFNGLDGKPAVARLPKGLREPVAAWADTLAESALGTLSSWNARLVVPPIAFTHIAPASPTPAAKVATKD